MHAKDSLSSGENEKFNRTPNIAQRTGRRGY